MSLYECGEMREINFDWSRQFWTKRIANHVSESFKIAKPMFIDLYHLSNRTCRDEYRHVLECWLPKFEQNFFSLSMPRVSFPSQF